MILPVWEAGRPHSLFPVRSGLSVPAGAHAPGPRHPAFSPLSVPALCLCFFACLVLSGYAAVSAAEIPIRAETVLKKVTIRRQVRSAVNLFSGTSAAFLVEVIKDKEGLRKGLSFREGMPEQNGILFVLDVAEEHGFWMKDMRFPLDIIFIGKNMQITEVLENLQPCEQCPVYFPKKRPAYALEINAGLARKLGIAIGDAFVIE